MARKPVSTHEQASLFADDPDAQPETDRTITITHVNDEKGFDVYGGRVKRGGMHERRPGKKGWLGNPFRVADYGREECIDLFRSTFLDKLRDDRRFANAVYGLKGKVVACHCRHRDEDEPACHLDVVREALLNGVVARACYQHDITIQTEDLNAHIPDGMQESDNE